MDIDNAMDQYEKQLYTLFESYDTSHAGSLNRESLVNLCESLQLEDRGRELVDILMADSIEVNVSFTQFRDGLLSVLGGEANRGKSVNVLERSDIHSGEDSSGREVSPKFTYGSKKYGRRSRPVQSTLLSPDSLYSETIPETDSSSLEIQNNDTDSQSAITKEKVISGKKRRTNKLRRSISFSGTRKENEMHSKSSESSNPTVNSMQGKIFHKPITDMANESIILNNHLKFIDCNSNNQQNVNKFVCSYNSSLQNSLASEENSSLHGRLNKGCELKNLPSNSTVIIQSYCENSEEPVSLGSIMELWESAGVQQPVQLLNDLGFKGENAKLSEVISVLEDEISLMGSNMQEVTTSSPLTTLLQAVVCLHKCEIKNLKTTVVQTSAERDKLRTDLSEANLRATLLAQEVDDNHSKMENTARNNIKQLEQKHADIVKQLTNQIVHEKEQAAAQLCTLEQKTTDLEMEESKLKLQISTVKNENIKLEKEVNNLQEQISELVEIKKQLSKEIKILSTEKQQVSQCSLEKQESLFFDQISMLQKENIFLRDRNDELCAELESLHIKIPDHTDKLSSEQSSQIDIASTLAEEESMDHIINLKTLADVSGVNGVKRRGDSPSKCLNDLLCEEESPRICKLRKYHKKKSNALQRDDNYHNIVLSDSITMTSQGYNQFSKHNTSGSDTNSEVEEGNEKIDFLVAKQIHKMHLEQINQLIKETNTLSIYFSHSNIKHYYLCLYWLLKNIIHDITLYLNQCGSSTELSDSDIISELQNLIKEITVINLEPYVGNLLQKSNDFDKQFFYQCCSSQEDIIDTNIETNHSKIIAEVDLIAELKLKIEELSSLLDIEKRERLEEKLKADEKYNELEASVELLKNEYDKCEEYWASKLDEEREIFDQEQRMSDEKFTELVSKVTEYEDQFASHDVKHDRCDGPLSTIEEKYNLEKQFTDLEDEFEEYKLKTDKEINVKTKEIDLLTEQIRHFEQTRINIINNEEVIDSDCNVPNVDKPDKIIFMQESKTINSELNLEKTTCDEIDSVDNIQQTIVNESQISFASEHHDNSSSISSPIDYLWNQKAIPSPLTNVQNPSDSARDYQNPAFLKDQLSENGCSFLLELPNMNSIPPIQKPVSPKPDLYISQDETILSNKFIETRHEGKMLHCSELEEVLQGRRKEVLQLEATRARLDAEVRALSIQRINPQQTIGSAGLKTAVLEVRCRQLQTALRQQHSYTEAIMQQTLAAHRGEVGALRQRLAAADLLVRDLYVENCHLARSLTTTTQH